MEIEKERDGGGGKKKDIEDTGNILSTEHDILKSFLHLASRNTTFVFFFLLY